jgi:hypothetical protein
MERGTSGADGGSRARTVVGHVLFGLVVLFLLMDGGGKALELEPFVEGTTELGFHEGQVRVIGGLLLTILALYAVPRTAVVGAVLLTGYLGGAVAIHVQLGNPLWSHTLFPVYLGCAAWGALVLRRPGLVGTLLGGRAV